jgi:ABC-2 type transport system permease protein
MRLLTQEWKKLIGSRQTLALLITVFGVGIALTVLDGVSILGEPETAQNAERVSDLYTGTIILAWIFPPILGALSVTSEFRLGTAIATFLQTPNRTTVLLAKMIIGGVGGAMTGAMSMVSAYLTAFAIVTTAPSAATPDVSQLIGAVVGMVTAGFAMGMFGVAVGALIRAQIASLAVILGWLLFVEGIIAGMVGQLGIFLPGKLVLFAVYAPGDSSYFTQVIEGGMTAPVAVVGIIAWALIVGLIASVTTLRKDID